MAEPLSKKACGFGGSTGYNEQRACSCSRARQSRSDFYPADYS